MVQPPNPTSAALANNDIQLKATTTDTLQYLATRVGEIVEAKVVKVTNQLVSDKASLETKLGVNSAGNSDNKAENKQPMDLSGRKSTASAKTAEQLNPNRYEVLMNVGSNKTLSVQSPLAPRIGQILQLQVLSSQQIEIVGLRTGGLADADGELSTTKAMQHTSSPQAVNAHLQKKGLEGNNSNAQNSAQTEKTLALLNASLRNNLPKQVSKSSMPLALQSIIQQPSLQTTSQPSSNIQAAVADLQNSISSLQQLIKPEGLMQAFRNNGLFYEAKIAQLLPQQNSKINTQPHYHGFLTNSSQATSTTVTSGNADHKQALINLILAIKNHLSTNHAANEKAIHPALKNNATLASLWALVANSTSTSTTNARASTNSEGEEQLLQLLRTALTVVTRLQSQQLFNVNTQFLTGNDNIANQSWSLELPVWVDQKLNLIDVQIDTDNNNDQQSASSEKAWNARLAFDLEEHGKMVAFATLRGKTIAAVLWVTETATVDKVNAGLASMAKNLDRLGLSVERLQCRVGEPQDVRPNGTINLLDTEA